MSWTDERVERLQTLWKEGKTASRIAGELGGVSRNAVLGKIHRLGLSARKTTRDDATSENAKPKQSRASSGTKSLASKAKAVKSNTAKSAAAKSKADKTGNAKATAEASEAKAPRRKSDAKKSAAVEKQNAGVDALKAAMQKKTAERRAKHSGKSESPAAERSSADPNADRTGDTKIPFSEPTGPETAEVDEAQNAALIAAEVEKKARKLSLLELSERTCKWPIGDPSTNDFYFCGLPAEQDKPYCEAHCAVAYQPNSSRRDRERQRLRQRAASA